MTCQQRCHFQTNVSSFELGTYGALEGEEVFDDWVVSYDGMSHDEVEEATQSATSLLDKLFACCKQTHCLHC